MLSVIKKEIESCKEFLLQNYQTSSFQEKVKNIQSSDELARIYEQEEVNSLKFKKNLPAMIMQKNQVRERLEKLEKEYEKQLIENTKVFLVLVKRNEDVLDLIELTKNKACVFFNHKDLAYKVANFLMPAIRIGDCFNSNLMNVLNDILDTVEIEIGVDNFSAPRLEFKSDCIFIINSFDDLVNGIEYMLETQMYPSEEVKEGHFLQALFNKHNYLLKVKNIIDDTQLNCVIAVANCNKPLVDEYKRFFSNNIYIVTLDELDKNLNVDNDCKVDENDTIQIAKRKYNKKNN